MVPSPLLACLQAGGVSHLVQCLDLVDCIRLACCSKAAHAALQEQLAAGSKPVARQMLVEYVKQAGNCTPQSTSSADRSQLGLYAHEQQQVHWLVQQAGPMHEILRCGSHIAECMSIDKVPAAVAIALVHSGLRFTYEQLMSAVQQHVRGAEVWVQAYRQLGIQRPCGMPYIAEVLCCSDKVVSKPTDTSTSAVLGLGGLCLWIRSLYLRQQLPTCYTPG